MRAAPFGERRAERSDPSGAYAIIVDPEGSELMEGAQGAAEGHAPIITDRVMTEVHVEQVGDRTGTERRCEGFTSSRTDPIVIESECGEVGGGVAGECSREECTANVTNLSERKPEEL
jgi:hypothetical protein